MEAEEYEFEEIAQGPCRVCTYEDELDNAGLCADCNPVDDKTRIALSQAFTPVEARA